MAGHTPGPWSVEDRRAASLKNVRIVSGQVPIAEVSHVHQRDYLGTFDGDHASADQLDAIGLANAAFIVRACNAHEDLLAACEAALERIQSFAETYGVIEKTRLAIHGCIKAIAKARG
jgi:hypothetical protein